MSTGTGTDEPLMTARQVAEWLGYGSTDSIYRLCESEGLPCRKMLGRSRRFVRAEVQAWLDGRKVEARPVVSAGDEVGRPVAAKGRGGGASVAGDWREEFKRVGRIKA